MTFSPHDSRLSAPTSPLGVGQELVEELVLQRVRLRGSVGQYILQALTMGIDETLTLRSR